VRIPLVGGAYEGISKNANAQTCINLYPQPDPSEGGEGLLIGTPGFPRRFDTHDVVENLAVRALVHPGGSKIGAVVGTKWVELNSSGTTTDRSAAISLSTTKNPDFVATATNGTGSGTNYVLLADGAALYTSTWNGTNFGNLTAVTSPITFASNTVTYMDGRFIVDDQNNRDNFYYTGYNDVTFVEFAFAPDFGDWDDVLGVSSVNRKLFVFGQHHVGVYYDTGTSTVFQRYQNGYTDTGCAAIYTAQPFDGNMVWLAGDERGEGYVVIWSGSGSPQMISTPQINERLSQWRATMDDSFAFTMNWRGHEWYVLQNDTANETWVFDSISRQWFQWASYSTEQDRMHINCHTYGLSSSGAFAGAHFLGSSKTDDSIYRIVTTDDNYFHGSREIIRERTTVHVSNEEKRINIVELQLDMEEGVSRNRQLLVDTTTDTTYAKGAKIISLTTASATITGTNNNDNSSECADLSASWVENEHVGRVVTNTTKSQTMVITRNTTQELFGTLTGGEDWDLGNTYSIAVAVDLHNVLDITMDNGVVHSATIESISGADLTIGEPLPFAATSGAVAKIYENTGCFLEVSKDGGQTFGNKRWAPVGVSGEQDKRVIWRKLGWGRNWVFRFTFYDFYGLVRLKGLTARLAGER
jgi:hypothetical protein